MGLAILVGNLAGCFFSDWCGRRITYLLAMLSGLIGWLTMYSAQNYEVLLLGRILSGFSVGGHHIAGLLTIVEFTSPANRGMFLNLKTTGVCVGSGFIHILGNFLHWRTITLVALIPQLIALFIAWTWPESPSWLASRKRYSESQQAFYWLRGMDEKAKQEINELIQQQKTRLSQPMLKISPTKKILYFFRKFTQKNFLMPFLIACVTVLVKETSGRHYFPTYALQIVKDAVHTKTLPYYYTLSVDVIIIISSISSSFFMRIMKRRTLLFSTGIASLVLLFCICIYLYLVSIDVLSEDRPLLIIFLFITFFFFTNLACSPMPITLQGELFPLIHREAGIAMLGAITAMSITITVKVIPYLLKEIEVYGTFAVFGTILAGALIVLYFVLPETKDRTLVEIDNYFTFGKFREDKLNDDDNVHSKMINEDIDFDDLKIKSAEKK